MLQKIWNKAVSDLCVENKVANQVELANERWSILTEIMEDLHDLVGLKNFFEAM